MLISHLRSYLVLVYLISYSLATAWIREYTNAYQFVRCFEWPIHTTLTCKFEIHCICMANLPCVWYSNNVPARTRSHSFVRIYLLEFDLFFCRPVRFKANWAVDTEILWQAMLGVWAGCLSLLFVKWIDLISLLIKCFRA